MQKTNKQTNKKPQKYAESYDKTAILSSLSASLLGIWFNYLVEKNSKEKIQEELFYDPGYRSFLKCYL